MARDFRSSRFRSRRDIGEDVNPSAYIVNLADCMLVLACGFLVALISFWQIDLVPTEKLDQEQLKQVEPEQLPEEITADGSYYIEAGKVYQDPNTGLYYIVTPKDENGKAAISSEGSASNASGNAASSSNGSSSANPPSASDDQIRNSRAMGAD